MVVDVYKTVWWRAIRKVAEATGDLVGNITLKKTGNTTSKSTWEDTEIVFPGYYGDAYIFVKRTVTITGAGVDATAKREDKRNKQITFINCAPFTNCIS